MYEYSGLIVHLNFVKILHYKNINNGPSIILSIFSL